MSDNSPLLSAREQRVFNACIALFMGSILTMMALGIYADNTGGTPNRGKQEAGRYFLGNYSKSQHKTIYTPVSKAAFRARQNGEAATLCLIPVAISAWGIGFFLQERGKKRRRRQNGL